jgi:transcriptional regulator with XRE-family HTH domain
MKTKGRPTKKKRPVFGAKLAAARIAQGFTQEALAAKLGVDRSLIRYYERTAKSPKLEFIQRCSKALNIPISSFLENPEISIGLDPEGKRFLAKIMILEPRRRKFILRLFSRQLGELTRDESL